MEKRGYKPIKKRYFITKASILALFSILIGATLPRLAFSEDYSTFVVGPFGGLSNTDNSLMIPTNMAQDLLNVDLSKDGRSVKKRDGYSLSVTLPISTSPVHGIYNFINSSGQNVSLFFNDRRINSSVNEGVASTIYSTATLGATWDCDDYQGFAYCVNTSRDGLFKSSGTLIQSIGPPSTGTYICASHDRLVVSGISSDPNGIYFSKAYDFSNWSIGTTGVDPINFTITAPGAKITHIAYAFGRIVWFKDSSFGYIIEGEPTDNNFGNWVVKTISPNIGTKDNSSVYWNGILYFRGNDYHFYSFDGSNLVKISDDISSTIDDLFSSNGSWSQTSASDFASGSFSPATYVDTITASGSLSFNFPDPFTNFRDGTLGTRNVWRKAAGGIGPMGWDVYASGGKLNINNISGTGLSKITCVTSNQLSDFRSGTTYYFKLDDMPYDNYFTSRFYVGISSRSWEWDTDGTSDYSFFHFIFYSTESAKFFYMPIGVGEVYDYNTINPLDQLNGDPTYGYPLYSFTFPAQFSLFIATTTYQLKIGDITVSSGTHAFPNSPVYFFFQSMHGNGPSQSVVIDDFDVYPQTTTFKSQVYNVTAMSTWSLTNIEYQNNSGSHSFLMRSSNTIFTTDAANPSWTPITADSIPNISTGNYVQFRDDIAKRQSGNSPTLDSFTINWIVGTNPTDKSYATYFNDRIWWSVSSGIGQETNNQVLVRDLNNNSWLKYNIPINGFLEKNNSLYFASPSGGYVYKYGGTYSDNGSDISAYWKSKDFHIDNPFIEKEFVNFSAVSSSFNNSYATITYTLNGSTATAFSIPLYTSDSSFTQYKKNLPAGKVGKTINIKFGNELQNMPFEMFGIQIGYRQKPWKATQ